MSAGLILVVDDHPTNLKLACELLEMEGFAVIRASDAEQAFSLLERELPDLILMDIDLPGMDGLTLTRRLKNAPTTSMIPIVAMTAFAMKGDDAKALAAGCDGYITKPINVREFPQIVAKHLRRR